LPEDEAAIGPGPQLGDARLLFAERNAARFSLARNRAVVLDVSGNNVRDITAQYVASEGIQKDDAVPARVDVGSDAMADQLGGSWYANEGGYRWMGKRATVTLHGPLTPVDKLYLTGFCPAAVVQSGPLRMDVSVDGQKLTPASLREPNSRFSLAFDLPSTLAGRKVVEVAVEVDHTLAASADGRKLGIIFGTFEIR